MINHVNSSLRFEIRSIQKKRMEKWLILCNVIVYDGDVSCFLVLPIAEVTPEHAMLLTKVILKEDSS